MRLGSLGNGASSGTAVHATLGPGLYRVTQLSGNPDQQVAQTMRIMGERVKEDALAPAFQEHAARVFDGLESSDTPEIINRAYGHVRSAIRFQRDEDSGAGLGDLAPVDLVEFIVRPVDMARYVDQGIAIGDCDDFSAYLAALLRTQGIDSKFCTVAASDLAPDQYSHVYVTAYVDGQRIPLDASHGDFVGWEVEQERPVYRKDEWSTTGGCSLFSIGAIVAAAYLGWKALEAA
jgi:hypothetical protein